MPSPKISRELVQEQEQRQGPIRCFGPIVVRPARGGEVVGFELETDRPVEGAALGEPGLGPGAQPEVDDLGGVCGHGNSIWVRRPRFSRAAPRPVLTGGAKSYR